MNIAVFAYGRAGCRIAEELDRRDSRSRVNILEYVCALDTAESQLNDLDRIDDEWKVLYGERRFEKKGTRADLEPAIEAAKPTQNVVVQTVTQNGGATDVDAFVVIGGLGGGTGGSGAPIAAAALSNQFPSTPVYGIGVLPERHEPDMHTLNAARTIQSFARETDNLFLVDNAHLNVTDTDTHPAANDDVSIDDVYESVNEKIAQCIHSVFAADERDAPADAPGTIVNRNTARRILASGGLSTFTYVEHKLPRTRYAGLQGMFWRAVSSVWPRDASSGPRDAHAGNTTEHSDRDRDARSTPSQDFIDKWGDRDPPSPIALLPTSITRDAALFPIDPRESAQSLHLLIGPSRYMTATEIVAGADYIDEKCPSGYRAVKACPERTKHIAVVGVCSGVGVPARVNELQNEAQQIANRARETQQSYTAKDIDVFEDSDVKVPSAF